MIPISASPRGMPTAHPTIKPILLDPPPDCDEPPLSAPSGLADGVTRRVWLIVTTPAGPEEILVETEVKGLAEEVTAFGVALCALEPADDAAVVAAAAELPPPLPLPAVPLAKPVMVEIVGTDEAVLVPTVA